MSTLRELRSELKEVSAHYTATLQAAQRGELTRDELELSRDLFIMDYDRLHIAIANASKGTVNP